MGRRIERTGKSPVRKKYSLRLFIAGAEHNSVVAEKTLREICEHSLEGQCEIEIVDVLGDYRAAMEERIIVTPALIIKEPGPRTVIFGNLSDREKVLNALQMRALETA